MKRRTFIKAFALAGNAVCFGLTDLKADALSFDPTNGSNPAGNGLWVRVGSDNHTRIIVPSSEMGQGAHTSLAMILAEEMDADWKNVSVETGSGSDEYKLNWAMGQLTGGSKSIVTWWEPLRKIGASVRQLTKEIAAKEWNVPTQELKTGDGYAFHPKSGRKASFAELLAKRNKLEPNDDAPLKNPGEYKLVGKNVARLHNSDIVQGKAVYGTDVQLPGMLCAAIAHSPKFGGKLDGYDEKAALKTRGVKHVVPGEGWIAAVADNHWRASKGLEALNATFKGGSSTSTEKIFAKYSSLLDEGLTMEKEGAAKWISAEYRAPNLAHVTMEPMSCAAHFKKDSCELWAPTQAQTLTVDKVGEAVGLDPDRIRLHTTLLGGGFGRKAESDFPVEAALISKAVGKPVRLIWSREEDVQHDHYRPAALCRFQARIDEDGEIEKISCQTAGPSVLAKYLPSLVLALMDDPIAVEGLETIPYDTDYDFEYARHDSDVPVGFWRSVGHSQNAFFLESFIDELAGAAGKDPLEFRLKLLNKQSRHAKVLNEVAKMADWKNRENRKLGLAVHASFDSIVAQVVEVSKQGDQIRVDKVFSALDCGRMVNEGTVRDQITGGVVFGLSAAINGEITVSDGKVRQSNFHDYPLLKNHQTPDIEVSIVNSGGDPGGVGEPGTPPAAPALCNAIFALTGKRARELPLSKTFSFV